jgi:hypothetical protein
LEQTKKVAKTFNVEATVTDARQGPADDFIARNRKGITEGQIRKYDQPLIVKYDQWLTYHIDDAACGCESKPRGSNLRG